MKIVTAETISRLLSRAAASRQCRPRRADILWRDGVVRMAPFRLGVKMRRLSCLGMSVSPPTSDVWLRRSELALRAMSRHSPLPKDR